MPVEIERKFLVKQLPVHWQEHKSDPIAQGYLFNSQEGVVRVRQKGNLYFQTIKERGLKIRTEIEFELSEEQFKLIWKHIRGQRISKTRYYIPYGSHTIELDVFAESLSGLIVAEVEFSSVEESEQFEPPPWFGKEVTDDLRYQNNYLAIHGLPS